MRRGRADAILVVRVTFLLRDRLTVRTSVILNGRIRQPFILIILRDGAQLRRAVRVADRRPEVLALLEELGSDQAAAAGARDVVG